jgi:sugar phosphate isomerase/epimerase
MAATVPEIQCSTGPLWAWELEDAFDAVAEAGFTALELMVTRDPRTHTPELPARLAEQRGLRIAAVHAPFLVITRTVWGFEPLEKIRRGVAMCDALGAGVLVVHPPLAWERRYASWLRSDARKPKFPAGVTVAVETMYPARIRGRRLPGYRWLDPRTLHDSARHVVLDTSHVAVCGEDLLTAYRSLRDKLAHIHLSDNALDGRDAHLEPGTGRLAIPELLAAARADGYARGICLELSPPGDLGRSRDAVTLLRRGREWVERALDDLAGPAVAPLEPGPPRDRTSYP